MAKVISLSEAAYKELKRIKGNKSFSETILSLIKEKRSSNKEALLRFFGVGGIDLNKIASLKKVGNSAKTH